MQINHQEINFDELYQSCKKISEMVEADNQLGLKLNELFKGIFNIIEVEAKTISEKDKELETLQGKYDHLNILYEDLKKDYNIVYDANERKKRLINQLKEDKEIWKED